MTSTTMILAALRASLMCMVFAVGLGAKPREALFLFRHPGQLLRMVTAMHLVMPLLVIAAVGAFPIELPVKIALLALATSPVPPMLPRLALGAGGSREYVVGLLVSTCLLAVIIVPICLSVGTLWLGRPSEIPPLQIVVQMFGSVLAPLLAGSFVHAWAPALAQRALKPLSVASMVLLIVTALPVLIQAWPAVVGLMGNGMLLAFVVFVATGLLVGHLLGGPEPGNRTVLALATASRHPGIAIALSHSAFPAETLVAPALLAYLLVSALVAAAFLRWTKYQLAPAPAAVNARAEHNAR
jgi:BASS family bile acid:Na+ symporter